MTTSVGASLHQPLPHHAYTYSQTLNNVDKIQSVSLAIYTNSTNNQATNDSKIQPNLTAKITESGFKDQEIKNKNPDIITHNMFFNKKNANFVENAKVQEVVINRQLEKNPGDFDLLVQHTKEMLKLAECYRDLITSDKQVGMHDKELDMINSAKANSTKARKLNPLDACTFYIYALVELYRGVDCNDIKRTALLVKLLSTAHALQPDSAEILEILDNVIKDVKDRWSVLNHQTNGKEAKKFAEWNKEIDSLADEEFFPDFFKSIILKDPTLFRRANSKTMAKYPFLKSKEEFIKQFPELSHTFQVIKPEPQKAQVVPIVSKAVTEANKENQLHLLSLSKDLTDLVAMRKSLKDSKNTSAVANFANGSNKKIINKEIAQVIAEEMKANPKLSIWVTRQDEVNEIKAALDKVFSGSKTSAGLATQSATVFSENGVGVDVFVLSISF